MRQRFRSDGAHLGERAVAQLFGHERGASYGSSATSAEEARLRDLAVHDSRGELQDIAADGIADFNRSSGVGKFASVAWIAEMLEDGFTEHRRKYGKDS